MGYLQNKEDVQVWPENWPAVTLFIKLGTQWHVGMSGRTGLIYSSIFEMMDFFKLDDQEQLFDDIQHIEFAALNEMHKE